MCDCNKKCNCKSTDPCKCLDGKNAYTTTTASFQQPLCGENVTINVKDTEWAIVGQPVFVEGGGQYELVSKTQNTLTIKNLCGPNNTDPGNTVLPKKGVSPSGFNGLNGQPGEPGECNCPECDLSVVINPKNQNALFATVTGGTGPYTYLWEQKHGLFEGMTIDSGSDTNELFLNLELPAIPIWEGQVLHQGFFKLTVTDSTGCKKEEYYFLQSLISD
jgi:hypothetical protein